MLEQTGFHPQNDLRWIIHSDSYSNTGLIRFRIRYPILEQYRPQ